MVVITCRSRVAGFGHVRLMVIVVMIVAVCMAVMP
jgi:hypothetical protein